jgi:hypothetical protein
MRRRKKGFLDRYGENARAWLRLLLEAAVSGRVPHGPDGTVGALVVDPSAPTFELTP